MWLGLEFLACSPFPQNLCKCCSKVFWLLKDTCWMPCPCLVSESPLSPLLCHVRPALSSHRSLSAPLCSRVGRAPPFCVLHLFFSASLHQCFFTPAAVFGFHFQFLPTGLEPKLTSQSRRPPPKSEAHLQRAALLRC